MDRKILAVGEVKIAGHREYRPGHQRPAIGTHDPDVAKLRQTFYQRPQTLIVLRFLGLDLVVARVAEQLFGIARGKVEGFEHLRGMFRHVAERALQPAAGFVDGVAIGDPGRGGEYQERQNDRRDDKHLQRSFGATDRIVVGSIDPWFPEKFAEFLGPIHSEDRSKAGKAMSLSIGWWLRIQCPAARQHSQLVPVFPYPCATRCRHAQTAFAT